MDQVYRAAMNKSITKWLTDGRIDKNDKNIQLSLGSNLPLSNHWTFFLVYTM